MKELRSRRKFIRHVGLSGIAATVLASCTKAISNFKKDGTGPTTGVALGSGDTGLLNFAYALEQMTSAFYTVIIADPYENIDSLALSRLTDIRDHEIAHREFFKNLLGKNAIAALSFNFTSVNFAANSSVVTVAKTFEDWSVAAYNSIAALFQDSEWLTIAGKIASVEARHAAYVGDIIGFGNFAAASVVNDIGQERDKSPADILTLIQPYITEILDGSALPTT